MHDHLPLDAQSETIEAQNIPFYWALVFGVGAVIIPALVYLAFYFQDIRGMDVSLYNGDSIIVVGIALSFACPYIASVMALLHAKWNLKVGHRGKLFRHGLYVLVIPGFIGAMIFLVTLAGEDHVLVVFAGVFYIPYIIVGTIVNAVLSWFIRSKVQHTPVT